VWVVKFQFARKDVGLGEGPGDPGGCAVGAVVGEAVAGVMDEEVLAPAAEAGG